MNFGKGDENIVIFIIQNWSDKYLPVGTFVYELSLRVIKSYISNSSIELPTFDIILG